MVPQGREYNELYDHFFTKDDFEKTVLNTTCPSIEIIDIQESNYCMKEFFPICLRVEELTVRVADCIINDLNALISSRLPDIRKLGFFNDQKVIINETQEHHAYVKRSVKENQTNVDTIGSEVGLYNIDHFERDMLKLLTILKHNVFPQHAEVRATLMKLLEGNPASSLQLRVDESIAPVVQSCIRGIGSKDISSSKNSDGSITTFTSYKPEKLAQCAVDNGEVALNDISLSNNLSDIDLLSKWFKLQYIRLSSAEGNIDKNGYLGVCLGFDNNIKDSGIYNLNARGYAVIDKVKFVFAVNCAIAGTNITVILLNNDAAPSYYSHLKKILPYIIKGEELAGSGKEMSPEYRQAMIHLNKPMSNISEEEIVKGVNQMIQNIMINKLKPTPVPEQAVAALTQWWDGIHPDLRTFIIALVVGLPSCVALLLKLAQKKKVLCFKYIAPAPQDIELENVNDQENAPLAGGKVNKSYNAAEDADLAAIALTAIANSTLVVPQAVDPKLLQPTSLLSPIPPATVSKETSSMQASNAAPLNQQKEVGLAGVDSNDMDICYEVVTSL